jgi:alpha-galactosidase
VRNIYDILRRLEEKHPHVVFESCSSGGGRVDPGILALAEQVWTSDNTDPGDRLHIQYGFSYAFPAKAMVNWVTDDLWHGEKASLKFRFHVAMAGNLGIGSNLHGWTAEDKAAARELIALYKSVRHIIQFGDQYRLRNPFEQDRMAVQFVTRDGAESVVFSYQTLEKLPPADGGASLSDCLVLQGLVPEATYRVEGDLPVQEATGRALMSAGIRLPLEGNYSSKVIVLRIKS